VHSGTQLQDHPKAAHTQTGKRGTPLDGLNLGMKAQVSFMLLPQKGIG